MQTAKKHTIRNIIAGIMLLAGMAQSIIAQDMNNNNSNTREEITTLGAGCFWCVEAIFQRVDGVLEVQSGYSGGRVENPTYKEVCSGNTGHAEVCQVKFDPGVVSYAKLLEIFWKTHDPTTLNRQGNDVGTQYRSVIFFHNEQQKQMAEELKVLLNRQGIWEHPVVTEIVPFQAFYPAEDYHNNYYNENPSQGYCRFVITPKVEKFEKLFEEYAR